MDHGDGQDLREFNATDLGLIRRAGLELDGDGSSAIGGGGEGFDDSDILAAGGGEDVEVRQHLGAVDQDVELASACSVEEDLREVEVDVIDGARREVGNGV